MQQGAQISIKVLPHLAIEACIFSRSSGVDSEQACLCSISAFFLARAIIICKFTGITFLKVVGGSCVVSSGQKKVSWSQ